MKPQEPVFERSRSVEDMHHMRLMALLDELVRDKGPRKAAESLGVDHRTLTLSMERGTLSRRMRVALDRALLEGGGSPAAEQRERNDSLEGRLKEVEERVEVLIKDVSKGLASVQGDYRALREEHSQTVRRLAQLEAGGGPDESASVGRSKGASSPRREFPDLVTIEPAQDDEEVFGESWPLLVEWRELRTVHPSRGKGLAWLRTEERLLTVELALLEEHGMTLPPETYPLRDFARNGQINWRRKALDDTRRALAWRELLSRLGRVCTLGLWRR